jgi:hypothetical protein
MGKIILFLGCFLSSFLFSYSLWLINDSAFELNAIVHTATGDFIGQDTLQPGQQKLWSSGNKQPVLNEFNNSKSSMFPFTVTWQCSYEGIYSVVQDVFSGQVVKASQGLGSKSCKKKSDKPDDKCPACPPCPSCPSLEMRGSGTIEKNTK